MYAVLILVVHAAVSTAAALAVAPYSIDPAASGRALWVTSMASALLCVIAFIATAAYLGKRISLVSGAQGGLLCGLLCGGINAFTARGVQFSLLLYLALLVPTLVAVVLAVLVDRPKSGWQSARGRHG